MDTIFKPGLFSGKTAIITGGGTGIGFRIASELAQLGATVILASRKKEILDKAAEKIIAAGGKAYAVECNIRDEESVKNCIAKSIELCGKIEQSLSSICRMEQDHATIFQ